jgi:hypothetical protein
VVARCEDNPSFLGSCIAEGILEPGLYKLIIDPVFDKTADSNADYKKVVIDVYSSKPVILTAS